MYHKVILLGKDVESYSIIKRNQKVGLSNHT